MNEFIRSILLTGNYVLTEMEERIQKMYMLGKLTETEMSDLLALAADHAKDEKQIDVSQNYGNLKFVLNTPSC